MTTQSDNTLEGILKKFAIDTHEVRPGQDETLNFDNAKAALTKWRDDAITAHTNAEIAKVLDRAKQRFHEPIEHDGSYISVSVIDKTFDELIEAERAKLKERISSNEQNRKIRSSRRRRL